MSDERIYPCDRCGKMRTKSEGGTTFTVCDDCWDVLHGPEMPKYPTRAQRISWAYGNAAVDNPDVTRVMAERAVDANPRCCWCGHADPFGSSSGNGSQKSEGPDAGTPEPSGGTTDDD